MIKKLTAVQYIEEKIKKYPELYFVMSLWFEDAKEMEKQQIVDAYIKGNYKSNRDMYWKKEDANKYYNEEYQN